MRFIMQAQKMPLHMNGDNGQTVLNGRWTGSSSHAKVVNKSWNGKTLTDLKESIKFQRTEEFVALDELSKINAEL